MGGDFPTVLYDNQETKKQKADYPTNYKDIQGQQVHVKTAQKK